MVLKCKNGTTFLVEGVGAKVVTTLSGSSRAERRAGIDRGDRDLHSEADQTGIRRGVGTCHFQGREWEKGKRGPCARPPGTGLGPRQGQGRAARIDECIDIWSSWVPARDTARDTARDRAGRPGTQPGIQEGALYTTPREEPVHGNSRVTAPRPPL